MNGFLLAAAIVSLITFLAHLFWGGDEIVNPLLKASDLQEVPKLTTYYCWHIATLVLFVMTCAYVYVSLVQPDFPLTVTITSIAAACALLNMALIVMRQLKPLDYPQWLFFIPITLFGVLGLVLV
jgi:heme A synthase